ncbi:hypothetical protein [Novosphingobium cyanobacteriorum]|uniref:DUF551 domain-containing protein n=1 Tax=Novosphingobium cyanobacteriorum TaxID=3024215 RepID=A0ABT6CQ26_9SPHN|nr:hypothetical protein [Novosphingobium cyanobacteriorum]MDF8335723.1 hypothetical protein [Novosphingobium cyanobacteriorum]
MIRDPDPARDAALARFPLSRVSEAFHDDMLGVLPPVHCRGALGFFVSEAVNDNVHAQFVACNGRFYGAYVALRDTATWITHPAIAAFDVAHPDPPVLHWYPDEAGNR